MSEPFIDIKIDGLEEIHRALLQFPNRVANKVLTAGARAGGAVLRKGQRAAAPVRKTGSAKLISWSTRAGRGQSDFRGRGFLKKNIKSLLRKKKSKRGVKVFGVGPYGDAYYGYIVERGHRVGKRPSAKVQAAGVAEGVKHVPPHPFLIPTFYQLVPQILRATKDKLNEGIVKESKKLGFFTKR